MRFTALNKVSSSAPRSDFVGLTRCLRQLHKLASSTRFTSSILLDKALLCFRKRTPRKTFNFTPIELPDFQFEKRRK